MERIISSNDGRIACIQRCQDYKWIVDVDGKRGNPYSHIAEDSFIFSPNGRSFAYAAGEDRNGKWFVVKNGKEGKHFDFIKSPPTLTFSPDGKRLAYVAELNCKEIAVVDEVIGEPQIYTWGLTFSPD
ncbi:MAG: hypothetical protein V1649_03275, partial [Patescibacteria group bacterium]